jgi:hypothetical protein
VVNAFGLAVPFRLAGARVAIGGGGLGGLGHFLIRLFIWHEIFRLFRYLWRVPTFGPFIVIAIILIVAGVLIWRRTHGPFIRRGGGPGGRGRPGGGGGPAGPRDW